MPKTVKHIIERADILQNTILLEQIKSVSSFHFVCVFIALQTENLKMRRFSHYENLPSLLSRQPNTANLCGLFASHLRQHLLACLMGKRRQHFLVARQKSSHKLAVFVAGVIIHAK